ncbi:hypothetical protein BH23GEM7_BH23GEM7_14940 [soil metagenome]|nr:hypothetical protein [Gemmatimonadota bacterium]
MLGMINTRMKDFFDLWVHSTEHEFHGATLADATRSWPHDPAESPHASARSRRLAASRM